MVIFGAEWCGSCHIIEPVVKKAATQFENQLKIGKFDVEEDNQVMDQYGIQDLPTFLFFKEGEVKDHLIGTIARDVLIEKIEQFLRVERHYKIV